MKKLIFLIFVLIINCGKKSEITWDTSLYSDAELTQKIMDIKKGTVGIASEYRNHQWNQKKSIKMVVDGKEGYISPKYVVIGQDPEKSVYKWGYSPKYKKFYESTDKKHYKEGYVYKPLESLSKEKIPLEELLK
jgi:hypothetical protein